MAGSAMSANVSELRSLARKLRATAPKVYRNTQVALRKVGQDIAADAARNASWSSRIPSTIRVSASGVNTVVVRAGNAKTAPHAAAYEHAGASGSFRHPVFGNGDRASSAWVDEPARPFLHPAATKNLAEKAKAVGVAVSDAVDEAVL